ncbi:MAG: hypothetical protein E6344_17580 [Clostridium sp.]|nr:hypothetical protein [Clostridium culturomicium]MDU4891111.1 hypothetical protein [Clostridium sp.]MDU7085506.1 hypothetical protein [Clostridium sp.]
MKDVYQATHVATSPRTKQQLRKFKEEFSEEMPWRKAKRRYSK